MGGTLLLAVLAAVSAATSAQIASAHVGSAGSSSNFQGQGAALSENVLPDGSRQSECAYADSNGQQIQVRFRQRQGGQPQYTLIKGSGRVDPAAAYEQCLQQYRASQQASAAFVPDINAFNPFAGGIDFGDIANVAQGFAFAGGAQPGFQQGGAGGGAVRHAHDQVGAEALALSQAAQQAPSFLASQMELLRQQNLQLQQNVFDMQQRHLDFQNRLMGNFHG